MGKQAQVKIFVWLASVAVKEIPKYGLWEILTYTQKHTHSQTLCAHTQTQTDSHNKCAHMCILPCAHTHTYWAAQASR